MDALLTPEILQSLWHLLQQTPAVAALVWLLLRQLRDHDQHIKGLIAAVTALAGRMQHVEERLGIAPAPVQTPVPPPSPGASP